MGGGASKNPNRAQSAAPKTDAAVAAKLGKVLATGNITKVILIRHANAKPRDPEAAAVEAGQVLKPETPFANAWTVGDLVRPLTEKGEQQAADSRAAYLDQYALKAVNALKPSRVNPELGA